METEPDLNLETDRLEQLLETPPPPQSVVVVEYRNRGVPTWIFFPLIVLVPLGALLVYDRTVTQRERVEATLTRQSLESLAAKAGTNPAGQSGNSSAANPAPGGSTLFIVQPAESPTNQTSAGPQPATSAAHRLFERFRSRHHCWCRSSGWWTDCVDSCDSREYSGGGRFGGIDNSGCSVAVFGFADG